MQSMGKVARKSPLELSMRFPRPRIIQELIILLRITGGMLALAIIVFLAFDLKKWSYFLKEIYTSNGTWIINHLTTLSLIGVLYLPCVVIFRKILGWRLIKRVKLEFDSAAKSQAFRKDDENKLLLLSDEPEVEIKPSTTDSRRLLSEVLANAIISNDKTHVYGLNAPWGSGKTTIMKEAEKKLRKDPNCILTWFGAWSIESSDYPISSMIEAIRDALSKHPIHAQSPLKKVAYQLREFCLDCGLEKLSLWGSLWDRRMVTQAGHINYQRVARALKQLETDCSSHKIVVFIDDIDRCDPSKAIDLLDSLKSIFNQNLFIFVVAYDRKLIETHIQNMFAERQKISANAADAHQQAAAYLDKIIQTEIEVPTLHESFEEFIDKLTQEDSDIGQILEMLRMPDYQLLFKSCLKSNPRSTIKIINQVKIDGFLHESFYKKRYEDKVHKKRYGDKVNFPNLDVFTKFCLVHRAALYYAERSTYYKQAMERSPAGNRSSSQFMQTLIQIFQDEKNEKLSAWNDWTSYPQLCQLMLDIYDDAEAVNELSPQEISTNIAKTALVGQLGLTEERAIEEIDANLATGNHFDLADTIFSDLSVLTHGGADKGILTLSGLCLTRTLVTDIQALKQFTQLTHLRLAECKINDLSPLSGLATLKLLDISDLQSPEESEASLNWPGGLAELRYLFIQKCAFAAIDFVKDLEKLEALWIDADSINKYFPPSSRSDLADNTAPRQLTVKVTPQQKGISNPSAFLWNDLLIQLEYTCTE